MPRAVVWPVLSGGGAVLGAAVGAAAGWGYGPGAGIGTVWGVMAGYFVGVAAGCALDRRFWPDEAGRYDVRVVAPEADPEPAVTATAALLGLDLKLARKLVTAGAPVRRGVGEREVRHLHDRFAAWGVALRVEPELARPGITPATTFPNPADRPTAPERWFVQGVCGLVLGGLAGMAALGTAVVPEPSAAGDAGSLLVLAFVPLACSCAVGLFWGPSWPSLTTRGHLALVATFGTLLAADVAGSAAIYNWLDSGQSSDMTAAGAAFLFVATCIGLAAPFSAEIVKRTGPRRRDPSKGDAGPPCDREMSG